MAQRIQLRNDSTVAWSASDPILAQGEVGVDTTLNKFKIGNGTSTWTELDFQTGDIADFVFSYDSDEGDSVMTVTDHDMVIQTVRDEDSVGSDCDINIEAADDVFIRAYGDEVGIYASDEVEIRTNNYDGQGTGNGGNDSHSWTFDRNGHIQFPDGTVQTTSAQGIDPLPSFLTWREGRTHLPDLNTHFGWNSTGLWFQNASESDGINSYPVFTDFTIPQNSGVVVSFDVNINDECSDVGVCVYVDGTTPQWAWDPNTSRIAAQFDCTNLELYGRTTEVMGQANVPEPGLYRVTFIYNPTASTDKVTISYAPSGSLSDVVETITLNEALPTGPYRVGFAADQNSSTVKTYMSYMYINVNDGDDIYEADLDTGNSGTTSDADLVLPVAIKDGDGDDFITFTRTSTNTARIDAPQDDLSLRSARDITLFPGTDGDGNVYIGWGDATITPNATNRVATIGDIQSGTTGDITFDGIKIIGAGTASGDGYNNSTIQIVPDSDLYNNDQYLIIDPTNPNHIHIRAGGTQDESNADLILGGERNNVYIEDDARVVTISTRPEQISYSYLNTNSTNSTELVASMPVNIDNDYFVNYDNVNYQVTSVASNTPSEGLFTVMASGLVFEANAVYSFTYEPTYNNSWQFRSDGYLIGPAMGSLFITGILNNQSDLYLQASDHDVIISSYNGGEYLGSSNDPGNQIAKLSDRAYVRSNVPTTSIGLPGEVAGLVADDANYHYYCTAAYDGTTHIWKRVAWDAGTWGV